MPRRALLATTLTLPLFQRTSHPIQGTARLALRVSTNPAPLAPFFDPSVVATVGIYDGDWFLTPEFERMLDTIASSPGTIDGARFFGLLTSGTPERLKPDTGGSVWADASTPPDFTLPFAILEALTTRQLTPFIALGFFPPAVSPNPISPPGDFRRWQALTVQFLKALASDDRFGSSAMRGWWFEVWNEPNEGRFWSGSFEQYLDLYRATSEAVSETGLAIRLGGPAMAYKPESETEDGPETMRRFLEFLRDEPDIRCDFISYHRKGTVDRSAPDPRRLWDASEEVERLVREIVPDRLADLEIINNEADEKIGFESPYPPRMDAFGASWLSTLVSVSAGRNQHRSGGMPVPHRFFPDNANLQLVEEPFDGRRSLYVPVTGDDRTRLVKTSAAVWYDLLPLLRGSILAIDRDDERLFPFGDMHVAAFRSDDACTIIATWFPVGDVEADELRSVRIDLTDLPWDRVNVVEYRIDDGRSNAYRSAGGGPSDPAPRPHKEQVAAIRLDQELSYRLPFDGPYDLAAGHLTIDFDLTPYATSCTWLTPFDPASIAPPEWMEIQWHGSEIDVTWAPVSHPQLLGYEVRRFDTGDGKDVTLTRLPIRPTRVADSIPTGTTTYQVRAVTVSGQVSSWLSVTAAS